jgi:D-3-phosphoglycerate dehydrogenase / 2-oxoglutarate reductase
VKTVIVAAPISNNFLSFLKHRFAVCFEVNSLDQIHHTEFVNIEGIVTSNKLALSAKELNHFPSLQWIARLGSGMEIIDTDYCKQKGIHCFSSPLGIANSVAEHAVGMLLNLQHRIGIAHQEIKNKQWIREANRGSEINQMTLGIIGFGHTGKAFAQKMSAFTDNIIAFDKYKTNFGNQHAVQVSLDEIKLKANIISLHLPLNAETKYYYNNEFIDEVKSKHILINTSRGEVANTTAILKGLQSGKITGACLDVLEEEHNIQQVFQIPNNNVEQLLKHNVILTPHIAGYSFQAVENMSASLKANIIALET